MCHFSTLYSAFDVDFVTVTTAFVISEEPKRERRKKEGNTSFQKWKICVTHIETTDLATLLLLMRK